MAALLTFLRTKLSQSINQLPLLVRALGLVWQAARRWTVIWACLLVLQGLLPIATVFLTRALVNELADAQAANFTWDVLRPALITVALLAGVMLVGTALRSLTMFIRTAQAELVQDHLSALIHAKSVAVDMRFYDSPDYFDRLHRARYQATSHPIGLLENLGSLLQNGLTLVAMAAVLIPYGLWLPLMLVGSSLPAFYLVLQQRLRLHRWHMQTTASERRAWYYFWLLTERDSAAEIRIFNLGPLFQRLYQSLRAGLRQARIKLARDQSVADFMAGASGLLVMGATMAWLVTRTVAGTLTLGDLAFLYEAFSQGQKMMRSLLDHAGEIYSNSLFLSDLFEFLDLTPQIVDPPHPQPPPARLQQGIVFEQVSFRYPDSVHYALQEFDLVVPAGKITAIVGENGAGKSTLVKLLCRFYDPDGGRILVDGVDMRAFAVQDVRRLVTLLFQEPIQYNDTAAANIALGSLAARDGNGENAYEVDRRAIEAAAQAAGADTPILRLPEGYDTLLGKWFDGGADLSVGEWQRVALARAYLRQAPIIVLDEPTSAMDPWAEVDWLQRFRSLAQNRTSVIITHRFTTAMQADIIHVMAEGRIVESGSHRELLAMNGAYATSWRQQMREVGAESVLQEA